MSVDPNLGSHCSISHAQSKLAHSLCARKRSVEEFGIVMNQDYVYPFVIVVTTYIIPHKLFTPNE